MAGLMDELTAIKAVEDKITSNKVANFAYTDTAYQDPATYADGVETYDPEAEQNIPVANASTLKVNATILTKGWRAQASAITRMLMNHFLGRISYNLNKVNDLFSLLLTKLMAYIGQPNGIATLNSDGALMQATPPIGSTLTPMTKGFLSAIFSYMSCISWKQAEGFPSDNDSGRRFTYANGLLVCGGSTGSAPSYGGFWWSEDNGRSWTLGTSMGYSSLGEGDLSSMIFAGNLWVASTYDDMWWSENGKDWYKGTSDSSVHATRIVYGNGKWIASTTSNGAWVSEDGKSWTKISSLSQNGRVYVAFADNIWVASNSNRGIMWSEDTETWSQATGFGSSYTSAGALYNEGLWTTGSDSYGVWWSTDGKVWTQGTGINGQVTLKNYANGVWFAHSGGVMYCSYNGKDWTQCTGITSVPGYIISANGIWSAGGSSSEPGVWYSADGKAWSQGNGIPTTSGTDVNVVIAENGIWLATDSNTYTAYRSTDGINWSPMTGLKRLLSHSEGGAIYVNGTWVVTSVNHGIWYSSVEDLIEDGTINLGADVPIVD